jgi:hypothetical protein
VAVEIGEESLGRRSTQSIVVYTESTCSLQFATSNFYYLCKRFFNCAPFFIQIPTDQCDHDPLQILQNTGGGRPAHVGYPGPYQHSNEQVHGHIDYMTTKHGKYP